MSRFDQYRSNNGDEWPELRKLQPGESFVAKLTGDHEFWPKPTRDEPEPKPLPVLEFDEGDSTGSAPFNWMASAWKARDELAVADPHPGDMVTVTRLADKGRSQDWVITIAQRPKPSTAERAVVNFGDEVPFGTDDE